MPRFEKGTRFYTLTLEQDLLGDWVVVTVYGRTGTSLGQVRIHAFPDKDVVRNANLERFGMVETEELRPVGDQTGDGLLTLLKFFRPFFSDTLFLSPV